MSPQELKIAASKVLESQGAARIAAMRQATMHGDFGADPTIGVWMKIKQFFGFAPKTAPAPQAAVAVQQAPAAVPTLDQAYAAQAAQQQAAAQAQAMAYLNSQNVPLAPPAPPAPVTPEVAVQIAQVAATPAFSLSAMNKNAKSGNQLLIDQLTAKGAGLLASAASFPPGSAMWTSMMQQGNAAIAQAAALAKK